MNKALSYGLLVLVLCVISSKGVFGISESQAEYEKSISSVVRHKHFYKSGRVELTGAAGAMPYDSVVNHLLVGARADWHLTDHVGWEIGDLQFAFPTVTGFTTGLVAQDGLSNLQTVKLNILASTNLLVSPLYGKIRFFGRQVLYFDIYVVLGGGMANTQVIQLSSPAPGVQATTANLRNGWDPMFDFGFGIKIFMNDTIGLVIDMRDYVVDSQIYGGQSLKSNFSVSGGLSFFLPNFG